MNNEQTTNNQQPTTNNQQPTTNNQQPTTNNQQPTTNNQQPTTNLQAGEIALNEGDYQKAIALLTTVIATETDATVRSRARKALVVAYTQSQQIKGAITFCQSLQNTPDSDWAGKTLADLSARYPAALDPEYQDNPTRIQSSEKTTKIQKNLLPETYAEPSKAAKVFVPGRQWRNGSRAKRWKKMQPLKLRRLWLTEVAVVVAFFSVLRFCLVLSLDLGYFILEDLLNLNAPGFFYNYQNLEIAIGVFLFFLFIFSPWLTDIFLEKFHGLKLLPLSQLASQKLETAKLLQSTCIRKKIPFPALGILPTSAPIAMTYGNLPHTARIVISQGLLETLEDQELATIYLFQLGQIIHGDYLVMSPIILLLQLPYTFYWQTARWGEKLHGYLSKSWPKVILSCLETIIAAITALFYGIYWLWRLPVLWLSRRRCYYSDRFASQYTGNPNALMRAHLKITMGMAEQIKFQGYTNWLLESFDLWFPIGPKQAVSLGAIPDYTPYEKVLAWECTNPYRQWLTLPNSHPLLGDRLYLMGRYAYFWLLEPEVDLPALKPAPKDNRAKIIKVLNCYQALPILQSAFLSGLFFGLISRNLLRVMGMLCNLVGIWQLNWLYQDNPFLDACILFAFSLSIISWLNGYFPDIKIAPTRKEPRLQDLLTDPDTLPPTSEGVRLTGKLLGRKGIANGLAQDLILETKNGLIKLHFFSWLGPLGNIFHEFHHPHEFIGHNVTISGWFRRSSTPWIDLDTLETATGKTIRSGYPIWVLILAIGSALAGSYLIIQG